MRTPLLPLLPLLLLIFSSCNPAPDYVTFRGSSIYLRGHGQFLPPLQADALESALIAELRGLPGYTPAAVQDCMEDVLVELVEGKDHCAADFKCGGEQHGNVLHVVVLECAQQSAYTHEMTHYLQLCLKGLTDHAHDEPGVWEAVARTLQRCPPRDHPHAPQDGAPREHQH